MQENIVTPTARRRGPGLGLVGFVAVALACTGCLAAFREEGSGMPETTTFEFDSFDGLSVGGAFDVEVTVADGPTSVEVTVDDNLTSHLDVSVEDGRLRIGFDRGNLDPEVQPRAVVRVDELHVIDVGGASVVQAHGIDTDRVELDVSGASRLTARGTIGRVDIEASGASRVDVHGVRIGAADVDLSGASLATLGAVDEVNGELSGASKLLVPDDATTRLETSGASSVQRT